MVSPARGIDLVIRGFMGAFSRILTWEVLNLVAISCPPLFVQISKWFPFLKKPFARAFYDAAARRFNLDNGWFRLMNYGYASHNPSDFQVQLDLWDQEEFKFSWQLVYETVKNGRLAGKDVLVVGCGRGGDAYFIKRYMNARKVIGVDLSEAAIGICLHHYQLGGLTFEAGDAERLAFNDRMFDAAVNIESSHGYPNLRRFYGEVYRVLKPGGVFLYADFFWNKRHKNWLEETGFEFLEEEDITRNIVLAAEEGYERRRELVRKAVPKHLFNEVLEWSGTKGTQMYRHFKNGKLSYQRFVVLKPDDAEGEV